MRLACELLFLKALVVRIYTPQWVYVRANIKTDLSTRDALFIL